MVKPDDVDGDVNMGDEESVTIVETDDDTVDSWASVLVEDLE